MSEQTVYGAAEVKSRTKAGSSAPRTKARTHHLQKWKAEGHKWAMLTAYDYSTARVFDDAEIPVLLVGDSAADNHLGYSNTVPVTGCANWYRSFCGRDSLRPRSSSSARNSPNVTRPFSRLPSFRRKQRLLAPSEHSHGACVQHVFNRNGNRHRFPT